MNGHVNLLQSEILNKFATPPRTDQTVYKKLHRITVDKEVIDDNYYYDKVKSIENKIEIISNHSGMYNYGDRMEKAVRLIFDGAEKDTLDRTEAALDIILKEIVEE